MKNTEIDLIRDVALMLDRHDKKKSLELFRLAQKVRPEGKLIRKKIKDLEHFENTNHWSFVQPRLQVNEDLKVFFIHIPKTGGTSIDDSNLFFSSRYGHAGYDRFKKLLAESFLEYKCFTLVRNPWDRLASAFYYLSQGGAGNTYDLKIMNDYLSKFDGKFELFLEDFFENKERYLPLIHFRKMVSFFDPKLSDIDFFIQKLEHIGDLEELKMFIGFNIDIPHKRKRKSYKNITKVYTERTFDLVKSIYLEDVKAFGYSDYSIHDIKN